MSNILPILTASEKEIAYTFAQEYVNEQRFFGEWPARWHFYIVKLIDTKSAELKAAGDWWNALT
jgi:hypothetical protein